MRAFRAVGLTLFLLGGVATIALPAAAQQREEAIAMPNVSIRDIMAVQDLVKVVQQQQLEIQALQKRLKALEAQGSGRRDLAAAQPSAPVVPAAAPGTLFDNPRLKLRGSPSVQSAQVPTPPVELPSAPGQQPPTAPTAPTELAPAPTPQALPEGERPKAEKPIEQLLVQENAILLPKGTLQIEPSFDYEHFSGNAVNINGFTIFDAIVIGTIRVDKIDRDILTGALTGRYGITNRWQADLRIPGVYRSDTTLTGVGTPNVAERTIDGSGLGDIEAGLSYQPLIGSGAIPDVIVRARGIFPTGNSPFDVRTTVINGQTFFVDAPTGNGFYGAGLQATTVWRSDPLVLYSGIGYTHDFQRNFGRRFGTVTPGEQFNWLGGANVALNDQIAVNFSVQSQYTFETAQNGVKVPGSSATDARFIAGTSIGITPSTTLLLTATAGLTTDAPNYALTISLPINF